MEWTEAPPKEPGWYWGYCFWIDGHEAFWAALLQEDEIGHLFIYDAYDHSREYIGLTWGDRDWKEAVGLKKVIWYGPITPPERKA